MEIEYLKRFVAVGEMLNFRKASDALFISQPALSHSIANIEKELGTPVFVRTTKSVAFTPAGEILFEKSRKILENYDQALAEISKVTTNSDNKLKIAYIGTALDNSLTPLIKSFMASEPDININLTRHQSTELHSLIEKKSVQFIIAYQEQIKHINGINYEVIDKEEFKLLVNSDNPLSKSSGVSIKELSKLPLIICEKESAPHYYNMVMNIYNRAGVSPNIVQTVRLVSDIYRLVDMGVGVAIMSYSPKRPIYSAFNLVYLPIITDNPETLAHNKSLVWCDDLSIAAKKFLKATKDYYSLR